MPLIQEIINNNNNNNNNNNLVNNNNNNNNSSSSKEISLINPADSNNKNLNTQNLDIQGIGKVINIKDMHKNVSVQVDGDFALLLPRGVYEIQKMEPRSKIRTITAICLFLAIAGIIGFGYFCQDQVCALSKRSMILQPDIPPYNDIPAPPPGAIGAASAQAASTGAIMVHHQSHGQHGQQQQQAHFPSALASTKSIQQNNIIIANAGLSYDDVLNDDFQFDMDGHDVMVFLHIQKTGGTSFGRHLVRDLDLKRPCECQRQRKRCYCFRPHRNENWLFSRYSTGWKCGLHADWTELTSCVDQELDKNEGESAKRRYFYISLIREPIARYMSEYRHVKRGATWKGSRHWCLGKQATQRELPPCYKGKDWLDVTIDEFAGCESNLAANRQTRMLADLALVGCYNKSAMPSHERERVMLASAKRNLAAMAYFGLTEYQKISQYIFEETFNLRFAIPFEQHNTTLSVSAIHNLRPDQRRKIEELNSLDLELYAFAKNLLFERFEHLKAKDNDFAKRFANLGNIYYKQGVTEFNWDSNIDETVSTEH
ncbi:heparan-sulfate 6-O-sulfotransferase 2 [Stomoxys calcitrans]|uniref:Heparan-sulfate 6-O-sulfotransferase n=1 Tax=Stomoxys calcitrans TaxID=35570 RepID=A0A1I8PHC5_STOCA|nr:heparan-sulfate 6-O-sulfotransferase 2 [Stomoxys calcitrans]XP_013106743.1 heparan-sulfate 6-O-sulfotransferase 2 [Stomoxys calcitrans]XP_013106744.1 heparan-sulfate 6-O-sulfotransferase 2 [Stomoxys calcitrans]XP_059218354.1 heparan-sulfate 6-O-sulfotransferase 2 [Stomoxys calcitrans]XP_059218355.1 heparan-sulfate 6-O-sulfotransferase 2 [Stomoxys calcitrans]XP_059218356.1 heparan-sulfate 6-O-sulfotransferase 2 [Stomoxys calcitrans]